MAQAPSTPGRQPQQDLTTYLRQMQAQLDTLTAQNVTLSQQLLATQNQLATGATTVGLPTFAKIKVNKPKEFHGSREDTSSFLAQCYLVFTSDPGLYSDPKLKINYAVSFLRGDAFKWYEAAIFRPRRTFASFDEFETLFKTTFGEDSSVSQDKAYADLQRLTQTRSCQAYSTKFVQLAARVLIDEQSKIHLYKTGLKPEIKLHLIGLRPQPATLSDLMQAAVEYDDALYRFRYQSGIKNSTTYPTTARPPPTATTTSAAPMDIDATQLNSTARQPLTKSEKQKRRDAGICVYDGDPNCPGKAGLDKCPHIIAKNAKRSENGDSRAARK